jgi:phosphoribosylformylglycinamidine synthase subunit PurQ / glutaminase
MRPTVNVLYVPGTNCQVETMRVFQTVGAAPRLLFLSDVIAGDRRLDDADILCVPGGFSFGDHLGAGAVTGVMLRTRLAEQFAACRDRPVMAICNGFQILVRAGCFGPGVALKVNASGTFRNEPDQRHVVADDNDSPWLSGLQGATLTFPCAHGEGRFVYEKEKVQPLWSPALFYPDDMNPDGSMDGIAGITSTDGLIFGLMDHPERARDPEVRMAIFENGVRAVSGGPLKAH